MSFQRSEMSLLVKKLSTNARMPIRGSDHAAGYDLFSAYDYEIGPMNRALIKTDISIKIPDGCYGRIASRSSLAWKHFVDVGAGVIDPDFRGNVMVLLMNSGPESYRVSKGDRIAQLIFEKIHLPKLVEISELNETSRGPKGFGSSGK